MAVQTKVGSFSASTSTGNQSITGVGFQPKAIIFYGNSRANDTTVSPGLFSAIGVAVSSTQRWALNITGEDNLANSNTKRRSENDACYVLMDPVTGSVLREADFVSMDADGFTVNWVDTDATAHMINYFAIGGDITQAAAGKFQLNTATGNQSISGIGFQPDVVLLGSVCGTTEGANDNALMSIGLCKSSGSQWVLAATSDDNSAAGRAWSSMRTDRCFTTIQIDGTLAEDAEFVSQDLDGFTINITDAGLARWTYYLALKGGQHSVGSFISPSGNGGQTYSGIGHVPKGLMVASGIDTTTGIVNSIGQAIGFTSGVGAESEILTVDVFDADPMNNFHELQRDQLIKWRDTTETIIAEATLSGFASDQFSLSWTGVTVGSIRVLYWSLGDAPSTGLPFFTTIDAKRI